MTEFERIKSATLCKRISWAMDAESDGDLALGWLRYGALRKLTPAQFRELCDKNLAGHKFDDLVDELIIQ